MTRIYTRGGDRGETSLGDGARVPKTSRRVGVYGDIDELNSALGCSVALLAAGNGAGEHGLAAELTALQSRLFDLGAVLADPRRAAELCAADAGADPFDAAALEGLIDAHDAHLAPLRQFILPGGTAAAAHLHLARTICRRAERAAVALAGSEPVPAGALIFLNRLSDYLFTAARAANRAAGVADVPWRAGKDA
ncbi:MAG: cob(I)yrinic acid a,c-diamide adenosyltransferase [bacterium]|nr:cob(I)yrinic acid a,c-diamide adenosyltransferase [bacterium]